MGMGPIRQEGADDEFGVPRGDVIDEPSHLARAVLPVAVHSDNAARRRAMIQHIAERGLQRRALAAVDIVPQHRDPFVFCREEPKRVCAAAVVDQHEVGKADGKQRRNRFLQFFVRIERRQNHGHARKIG